MDAQTELLELTRSILREGITYTDSRDVTEEAAEVFCRLAAAHKLSNVVLANSAFRGRFVRERLHGARYLRELSGLCDMLNGLDIRYAVIKGAPLSMQIYGSLTYRQMGDIDLVVGEDSLERVYGLLFERGYRINDENEPLPLIFPFGCSYHEITLQKSIDGMRLELELKRGSSAVNFGFNEWLDHTEDIEVNGIPVKTLDFNYSVLHLFINTYLDNEALNLHQNCRLRNYFDIAYLLCHRELDWDELLPLADHFEARHKLHRVLLSVSGLYELPEYIVNTIIPLTAPQNCNYPAEVCYYRIDHFQRYNSFLTTMPDRTDVKKSVFDRDYAVFEYGRFYKDVLYSESNRNIDHRISLSAQNRSSDWLKYRSYLDIEAYYRFAITEDRFDVIFKIPRDGDFGTYYREDIFFQVEWYDNDTQSYAYMIQVNSELLSLGEAVETKRADPLVGLYGKEDYRDELRRISDRLGDIVIGSAEFSDCTQVSVSFERARLFAPRSTLIITPRLCCRHRQVGEVMLGTSAIKLLIE